MRTSVKRKREICIAIIIEKNLQCRWEPDMQSRWKPDLLFGAVGSIIEKIEISVLRRPRKTLLLIRQVHIRKFSGDAQMTEAQSAG